MKRKTPSIKSVHRHRWLIEPLALEPTLLVKAMFGCQAVYLDGRLVLCLADRKEHWRGVLVPTERAHHAPLITARPTLAPHPVLPKWLYLPETADSFETDAQWLVTRIRARDPRIGIVPPAARRKPPRKDFNP
jgi:hypothetical protein